jgi:hypothetical protein
MSLKRSKLRKSLLPTKTRTSKQQKGDSPREDLPKEFLDMLKSSQFRGLWMFGTEQDFNIWMERNSNHLSTKYSGVFFEVLRRWIFPSGGTLTMKVLHVIKDLEVIRGQQFNFVSVSGMINPEVQQAVVEYFNL